VLGFDTFGTARDCQRSASLTRRHRPVLRAVSSSTASVRTNDLARNPCRPAASQWTRSRLILSARVATVAAGRSGLPPALHCVLARRSTPRSASSVLRRLAARRRRMGVSHRLAALERAASYACILSCAYRASTTVLTPSCRRRRAGQRRRTPRAQLELGRAPQPRCTSRGRRSAALAAGAPPALASRPHARTAEPDVAHRRGELGLGQPRE
jgi:hypothetical protein